MHPGSDQNVTVVGEFPLIISSCGKSGTTEEFPRYKRMSTENISVGDRKRCMAKVHVQCQPLKPTSQTRFSETTWGGDGSRSVTLQAHRANQGCVCRCQGLWGNDCLALQPQLQSAAQNTWSMGTPLPLPPFSIAVPGNMAKKTGMLLWMENRQYNRI